VTFTGRVLFEPTTPVGVKRFVLVDRRGMAALDAVTDPFAGEKGAAVYERPVRASVDRLVKEVSACGGIGEIVAVGDGALLDAAKLVGQRIRQDLNLSLTFVFVPCGAEPYRAFTAFSVVDADDRRERPTVRDPLFATAQVVLWDRLLESLDTRLIALNALDSCVHAIESIFSKLATPISRQFALTALRIVADDLDAAVAGGPGVRRAARVRILTAAYFAAEAFAPTKLGIAHSIASPLGTAQGITHDTINGVLGPVMVRHWGAIDGMQDAISALSLGPESGAEEVATVLDRYRIAAGLPASLRELGIEWETVKRILPRAAKSAGIPNLPRDIGAHGVEAFARIGWEGADRAGAIP
jgi:alcohol dehydrogenase class IV